MHQEVLARVLRRRLERRTKDETSCEMQHGERGASQSEMAPE
jgi:hypothetical protein